MGTTKKTRKALYCASLFKALAVTMLLAVGMSACSSDNAVDSAGGDQGLNATLFDYFPVHVGYSSSFLVSDSLGQEIRTVRYSAAGATTVDGLPGVYWNGYDQSNSTQVFSGVIFWDQNTVFHLANGSSSAEVILQEPLEVEASWDRWYSMNNETIIDTTGSSDPDVESGGQGVDSENKPGDDLSLSSFPTEGSSKFYVAALNEQVTSGGVVLSNCLEIVNAGHSQTVNRYWYAEGVGLVKYALNCQFGSDVGTENGELLSQ